MTQSKKPDFESTINIDELDLSGIMEDDTITITPNAEYTFDINDLTVDTIDISSITLDDTHWADGIRWDPVEFEDQMPSVAKVEDMCNDYPALEKAYENFKTIYKMVHQDWQGRQDDEDGQLPF